MATPIPALASQIVIDSTMDGIQVTGGSAQTLVTTRWYYFVSNRTATSNGQSLLKAIKDALDTSSTALALTWTVTLSSGYKVNLVHDGGGNNDVVFDSVLATNLGFTTATVTVPTGAGGLTATNFSLWWWTPDMSISETGPTPFDPAVSYGVPNSAGNAMWSSTMEGSYRKNGVQRRAVYKFNGVEFYYKIFTHKPTTDHTNKSWELFWSTNISEGRRVLMWRDRDNATGSNAPTEGTAAPYRYVEYQPTGEMRERMLVENVSAPRLTHYDVTWDFWVTENGETPLTD